MNKFGVVVILVCIYVCSTAKGEVDLRTWGNLSDSSLFQNYIRIREMATEVNIQIPEIRYILVGQESAGKSSFVERLVGFPINFIAGTVATRRPLHMTFIKSTNEEAECSLEGKTIECFKIQEHVTRSNQELHTFIAQEIKVTIKSKFVENMVIVDFPGLKAVDGEEKEAKEVIENMIANELSKPNTYPIVLLTQLQYSNQQVLRFLEKVYKKQDWKKDAVFVVQKGNLVLDTESSGKALNQYFEGYTQFHITPYLLCAPPLQGERAGRTFEDLTNYLRGLNTKEKEIIQQRTETMAELFKQNTRNGEFNQEQYGKNLGWEGAGRRITEVMMANIKTVFPTHLEKIRNVLNDKIRHKQAVEANIKRADPEAIKNAAGKLIFRLCDAITSYTKGTGVLTVVGTDYGHTLEETVTKLYPAVEFISPFFRKNYLYLSKALIRKTKNHEMKIVGVQELERFKNYASLVFFASLEGELDQNAVMAMMGVKGGKADVEHAISETLKYMQTTVKDYVRLLTAAYNVILQSFFPLAIEELKNNQVPFYSHDPPSKELIDQLRPAFREELRKLYNSWILEREEQTQEIIAKTLLPFFRQDSKVIHMFVEAVIETNEAQRNLLEGNTPPPSPSSAPLLPPLPNQQANKKTSDESSTTSNSYYDSLFGKTNTEGSRPTEHPKPSTTTTNNNETSSTATPSPNIPAIPIPGYEKMAEQDATLNLVRSKNTAATMRSHMSQKIGEILRKPERTIVESRIVPGTDEAEAAVLGALAHSYKVMWLAIFQTSILVDDGFLHPLRGMLQESLSRGVPHGTLLKAGLLDAQELNATRWSLDNEIKKLDRTLRDLTDAIEVPHLIEKRFENMDSILLGD